jgi:hypothetical protein
MVTQERLRELFEYREGKLYWKKVKTGVKRMLAGCRNSNGYWEIGIDRRVYKRHNLIFLYHNGYVPEIVDHIDNDSTNDRIENLRAATIQDNARNARPYKTQGGKPVSSKWKGIQKRSYKRRDGGITYSYMACIRVDGKTKSLGCYKCECDAAMVYNEKAAELFGSFAYLNISRLNYMSADDVLSKLLIT